MKLEIRKYKKWLRGLKKRLKAMKIEIEKESLTAPEFLKEKISLIDKEIQETEWL